MPKPATPASAPAAPKPPRIRSRRPGGGLPRSKARRPMTSRRVVRREREVTETGLPLLRLPETLTDGTILLDAHRPEDAETHWREEDEEMRRRFDAIRPGTLDETRAAIAR